MKLIAALSLVLLVVPGRASSSADPLDLVPRGNARAAEETVEVSLQVLTGIEYEAGKPLPKKVTKYDDRMVVLGGYMHSSTKRNTAEFLLVGDMCNCSGTPLVQHFIEVTLDGSTTDPKPGFVELEGKLSVGEKSEDGFVTSVYRLKGSFL